MKKAFIVLFLLVNFFVEAQQIKVVSLKNEPIPNFTLMKRGGNHVLIGDKDGILDVAGFDDLCNMEISHIAFQTEEICITQVLSNNEVYTIQLEEKVYDLNEIGVILHNEEEILKEGILKIKNMVHEFSFMRCQFLENTDQKFFHSFGVLNYHGLIDRNKKENKFYPGSFAFVHQKIRLINFDENDIPGTTSFPFLTETLNDVLWEFIQSKSKFEAVSSKVDRNINQITFRHKSQNLIAVISEEGNLLRLSAEFKAKVFSNGGKFDITGFEANFLTYKNQIYINEISMTIDKGNLVKQVFLMTHSFPETMPIPESIKQNSNRKAYFSALLTHSKTPDIGSDNIDFFGKQNNSFYTRQMLKRYAPNFPKEILPVENDRKYRVSEKINTEDPQTVQYLNQVSNFIEEYKEWLKEHELSW